MTSVPERAAARFTKQQRLTQQAEYQALFDTPDFRVSNRVFLVLAKKNSLSYARLGLVISKKKAKRAVDRNRIKRICRESFRIHQQVISSSLDVLVLLRSWQPTDNNANLVSQLEELWSKLLAKANQD